MDIELYRQLLFIGFGLALVLGAVSNASNFCTMGAVSDWVNMGDLNRMRAWMLAVAVAMLGVMGLEAAELIDSSLLTSNDTSTPPYLIATLNWPRHLVGGLLFGIGMTLASGCGSKTMVRLGGGNAKSLVVFAAIAASAWLMLFTSADHQLFLQWMNPLAIDLSAAGAESQGVGSVLAALVGSDSPTDLRLAIGFIVAALLLVWVFKSASFRGEGWLLIAGLVIGVLVAAMWYYTAGADGQALLEELDFVESRPFATGAQSLTFIAPTGHALQYLLSGLQPIYLTLALAVLLGTFAGSLVYAVLFRRFRFEWFASWGDFFNHLIGGLLMGVGGVLGMGCTVGQGISGASVLSLGSWITLLSIILGGALAMKYRYYRMLYEDASMLDVLRTTLADLRLLPNGLRKLDAL